jgi:ribosomal protein S18 acetylase RimI-like enzyme
MKLEQQEKLQIKIEKENIEDFEAVHELWHTTWLSTYPNKEVGVTEEDINTYYSTRFTTEKIQELKNDVISPGKGVNSFVAKVNGKVVGHFVFIVGEKEDQLESIYVSPEFQGKGVGSQFWNEIKNLTTKGKIIKVNVISYNQNAISFYEKLGFVKVKDLGNVGAEMPISKIRLPEIEMEIKV